MSLHKLRKKHNNIKAICICEQYLKVYMDLGSSIHKYLINEIEELGYNFICVSFDSDYECHLLFTIKGEKNE